MEDIVKELSTPVWWVTVVFAGILINVLAAFMLKRLEGILSKISSTFRDKSEQRRAERDQRIEHLRNDQRAIYLASLDEIRHRLRATQSLVLGMFLFTLIDFASARLNIADIVAIFVLVLATWSVFIGWISHSKSMSLLSEIRESQKQNQ